MSKVFKLDIPFLKGGKRDVKALYTRYRVKIENKVIEYKRYTMDLLILVLPNYKLKAGRININIKIMTYRTI